MNVIDAVQSTYEVDTKEIQSIHVGYISRHDFLLCLTLLDTQNKLSFWDIEKGNWTHLIPDRFLYGMGPDISERDCYSFEGFFGKKYDDFLAERRERFQKLLKNLSDVDGYMP